MPAVETDRVHVVRPHDEADEADRHHGVDHAEIAEDRLAGEGGNHRRDDPEGGQRHDVNFRVAEEPEQVLEQQRVAAALRIEEGGAEVAVDQQHGDGARQHRQGQHKQERRDQDRPHVKRHLVHGHAGRAHVEDGRDEVDGAEDRRRARQVQRQDDEVDRRPRVSLGRQQRIERPAGASPIGAGRARKKQRADEERERGDEKPERQVVQPRKRHVGCADHHRHEPVAEATDQRRHEHEKDHDQPVRGDKHVVDLRIGEELQAGLVQFQPHGNRQQAVPTIEATSAKLRYNVPMSLWLVE